MTSWYGATSEKNMISTSARVLAFNLKLNFQCPFRVTEVPYVGHLLTDQQVKPDPAKMAAVRLISPQRTIMACSWTWLTIWPNSYQE